MCYGIYLASDRPLPTSQWRPGETSFSLASIHSVPPGRLSAEMVEPVLRDLLTKPHLYYASAHTGCSCGFFYDLRWDSVGEEEEEQLRNLESAEALVAFLREQLQTCNELEMYVRWEGDQGSMHQLRRLRATPGELLSNERFTPVEEEIYLLTSD